MPHFTPESAVHRGWGVTAQDSRRILGGESTLNWHIDTEDGSYVLRNAGGYGEYVSMQAALLNHLNSTEFPYQVPRLQKTVEGNSVQKIDDSFYVMYPYLPGDTGVFPGYDYKELGAMLGEYHHYSQDFDWNNFGQLRSKRLFDDGSVRPYIVNLVTNLGNSAELGDSFSREYGSIEQLQNDTRLIIKDLARIGLSDYANYACHGDYSPDNVLAIDTKIAGLIDFGGVTIDPRVTDMATCISRVAIRNGEYDTAIANDLIEGYHRTSALDDSEISALIPLAFIDTVRSLSWQTSEVTSNPYTRVAQADAVDYMQRATVLRDTYNGGKASSI